MTGGIKLPTPKQSIYQERGPSGGRIRAQFDAGPALDAGSAGRGLGALAGGLDAWADVLEKQEYEKQILDAMAQTQAFQDRERGMLAEMDSMKGAAGFDAPAFAEDFYQKEGEALKSQAKGDFQKMYYEKSLASARDQGLNLAVGHRATQLEAYKKSVIDGEMSNLFVELDNQPGQWAAIEAHGLAAIRAANPGLDTTAKEREFQTQLAEAGARSATLRGDTATARNILNRFGDTESRFKLEKVIAEAESKARVEGFQREGVAAYNSGETVEFRERQIDRFQRGEINYDELDQSLKGVQAVEENDRKARKEREDGEQDATRQELAQLRANNSLTNDWILNSNLPGDEKDRLVKENMTSRGSKSPSLNSIKGREVDLEMTTALTGDIAPGDRSAITALANRLDPDAEYIKHEDIERYVKMSGDIGPLNEVFAALKENEKFKGDKAVDFYQFKSSSIRRLKAEGFTPDNPDAAKKVLEWVGQEVDVPGKTFDQPWYTQDPKFWPQGPAQSAAPKESSGPTGGGVGGFMGASMAGAGAVASAAMDMLTNSPMNTRAVASAQIARDAAQRQGLPDTPFSLEWVGQGLMENKPAREVVPEFAQDWAGQGRVSLTSLGKVHDYNDLIEKHALSQGIDPNLIAAMMYSESRGNRFAQSGAGARGLMQFMPDTARRFGITDPTDPEQSIRGACRYMRFLLDRFDGNVAKAVGAYNSGEGNVDRGRVPGETRKYVPQVLKLWMSAADDGGFATLTGRIGSGQPAGPGGFVAPLANMLGTSRFGQRNTGIAGASTNHKGLDLRAPIGTPVGAAGGGVVETAGYKGKNGNYVVIRHDDGRKTYYLHLKGFKVKSGQRVEPGQLIGHSGNSGDFKKSLAPHLDFRVWENGKFVDPTPFFAGMNFKKGA